MTAQEIKKQLNEILCTRIMINYLTKYRSYSVNNLIDHQVGIKILIKDREHVDRTLNFSVVINVTINKI